MAMLHKQRVVQKNTEECRKVKSRKVKQIVLSREMKSREEEGDQLPNNTRNVWWLLNTQLLICFCMAYITRLFADYHTTRRDQPPVQWHGIGLFFHAYPNFFLVYKISTKPWWKPSNIATIQWKFQDPKMEILYHIRPYFVGRFPEI